MGTTKPRVMNALDKRQVYAAVRRRYEQWYGHDHMTKGSCLYWTMTGMGVLLSLGCRALMQAGSMSWPIIPPHLDDGKQSTHFTYEWSPWREESQAALKLGL